MQKSTNPIALPVAATLHAQAGPLILPEGAVAGQGESAVMLIPTLRSALAGAALSFLLVLPGLAQEQGAETPLSACAENLETTKLVLTMWLVDHEDKYPETIEVLVPDYLVQLLRCPTADDKDYIYQREQEGKGFTLTCPGDHKSEGASDAPFTINDAETESGIRSLKPD